MRAGMLTSMVRLVLAALLVTPVVYVSHYLVTHRGGREAWPNDRAIDPGLAHAESAMVAAMSTRDLGTVLLSYTDSSRTRQMRRFIHGYAGHPTVTVKSEPADDGQGRQVIAVTCVPTEVQRVSLTWGWVDAGWRASPQYAIGKNDSVHAYPGCRS